MTFSSRTAQLLHEDHLVTIRAIESLESLLASARRTPPASSDDTASRTLTEVAGSIEGEVERHFSFEETHLFTRLAAQGDVGIAAHLTEEHRAILPLGESVARRARQGAESGFDGEEWRTFVNEAGALVERMFAHIQKEEMALLPLLDDILDPDDDMTLSIEHANTP